jgi:hypothetical protein
LASASGFCARLAFKAAKVTIETPTRRRMMRELGTIPPQHTTNLTKNVA